jgi:TetR/AcrR family transcriptional regulator, transcriptional repressor of bet genes
MLAVDHDERRRRIAEVTVDVIAREGLEAATIRRIAAELGGPTKIITHYFADKQELLVWAYRSLAEQSQRYLTEVIARDPTDIVGALMAMTAVDESQTLLWRVYIAFWDRAARDPFFAELQRTQIDLALKRIAEIIRARNGEREDVESVSQRLNALVQGISLLALAEKDRWSPERARGTLADEVEVVLGRASATV